MQKATMRDQVGVVNKNLNKLSNKIDNLSHTLNTPSNIEPIDLNTGMDTLDNMNNMNNIPENTSDMSSFCSNFVWALPIMVSVVQIILWLIKLYKQHVLKELTPLQLAEKKISDLEEKIEKLTEKKK